MVSVIFSMEILLYVLAGGALFMGSLFDLKTREVPDWLSYGLMFAGLGIRLIYSLAFYEWNFFFNGLVGFLAFVAFGYLMFYSGQWGGGDSKLLMGLGAVLGLPFSFNPIPLMVIFLVAVLLVGGVYGLGWIIILAVQRHKAVRNAVHKLRAGNSKMEGTLMAVTLMALVGLFLLWWQGAIAWQGLLLGMFPLGGYYGWLLVKSVENVAFIRAVLPERLTEGDWVAERIVIDGQKICEPKDLGLEKAQISKLIHLRDQGKIDKVLIKEGIPFVPSFFIAFSLTLGLRLLGVL